MKRHNSPRTQSTEGSQPVPVQPMALFCAPGGFGSPFANCIPNDDDGQTPCLEPNKPRALNPDTKTKQKVHSKYVQKETQDNFKAQYEGRKFLHQPGLVISASCLRFI